MIDALLFYLRGRRRARTLAEDVFHDIVDLWEMRAVTVTAKGKSITEVSVDVSSRWNGPLKVVIPAGTYFQARGSHQNMATTKESVLALKAMGTRFLTVPAACINADRPIPNSSHQFRGVKRVPAPVESFLRETRGFPPMVIQAGVWALTNGYSREQIKRGLVDQSKDGSSRQSISDADIDSARRILEKLGIHSGLS